jgi:hypothetical protein
VTKAECKRASDTSTQHVNDSGMTVYCSHTSLAEAEEAKKA